MSDDDWDQEGAEVNAAKQKRNFLQVPLTAYQNIQ
jgi:hypothetical protein